MFLSGPSGTLVDLDVEMVFVDQASAGTSINLTTVTVAQVYYLALDGPTTNLLVPVGLTTTS